MDFASNPLGPAAGAMGIEREVRIRLARLARLAGSGFSVSLNDHEQRFPEKGAGEKAGVTSGVMPASRQTGNRQ
jgi:hypothetical protein